MLSFDEIFRTTPTIFATGSRGPYRSRWGVAFKYIDTFLRVTEPVLSKIARVRPLPRRLPSWTSA